jgi:hypothetical protein
LGRTEVMMKLIGSIIKHKKKKDLWVTIGFVCYRCLRNKCEEREIHWKRGIIDQSNPEIWHQ